MPTMNSAIARPATTRISTARDQARKYAYAARQLPPLMSRPTRNTHPSMPAIAPKKIRS